jgi:WD40 repeat protein
LVGDAAPRLDRYGDPLPLGAIARMGTLRFFFGERQSPRITFAPDGKTVAASSVLGNHFWDVATGAKIPVPEAGRKGPVFSAGGRLIVLEGRESDTRFWDVVAGKVVGQTNHLNVIGLCPDGRSFLVEKAENQLGRLLRFGRIGEEALSEPVELGNVRQVLQLAFAPDGKTAAVRWNDRSVSVLDVPSRKIVASILDAGGGVVGEDIALAPDGSILAAAAPTGIAIFEAHSGKKLRSIPSKEAGQFVTFSPDGKLLAAGYPSPTIRLWDPATGAAVRAITGAGAQQYYTAFSPDGRTLAMADEEYVTLWDVATGRPRHAFGHTYAIWSFAFAPDGKTVVSGASYKDRTVRVWDPFTGVERAKCVGHTGGIESVAFTLDGRRAVTGSQDGTARVWDVATNTEVGRFGGKYGMVYGVAVAPDGRTLAVAHVGKGVRLWDLTTGQELRALDAFPVWTLRVQFAPDGMTLAGYSRDGHDVILADVVTGAVKRRFEVATAQISSLAFSTDGKLLATGSYDGEVRLWDVATGAIIRHIPAVTGPDQKSPPWVYGVTFSPDGRTIAAAYGDGAVRVWEVASGQVRAQFDGHRGAVLHVQFSPDGLLLGSSGSDRTILTWDVTGTILAPRQPIPALAAADLAVRWEQLAAADAGQAFRAIQALARSFESAVNLMADRLRPVAIVDGRQIAQLLTDLDSPQFAVRERAEKALTKLGDSAEPSLQEALKGSPSAEARRRMEAILERLEPARSPERLQAIRAVEVLERIGTPEARRVLERLAGGAQAARLTREAKTALERLSREVGR